MTALRRGSGAGYRRQRGARSSSRRRRHERNARRKTRKDGAIGAKYSAQVHHIGTIRTGIGRHLPRIILGGCLCIFEENLDLIVEHDDFLDQSADQPPWHLTEWIGQVADDFVFRQAVMMFALFYGDLVVDLTAPLFEFVHACFGRLIEDASFDRLHDVCKRACHFFPVAL